MILGDKKHIRAMVEEMSLSDHITADKIGMDEHVLRIMRAAGVQINDGVNYMPEGQTPPVGVWVIVTARFATSQFGAATRLAKKDGRIMWFVSEPEARVEERLINERLATKNVHYSAARYDGILR